jgi:hypothetical protein
MATDYTSAVLCAVRVNGERAGSLL